MHFEVVVEDQSGAVMVETLLQKILGHGHTIRVHSYKGIGRIPKGMKEPGDASKRILLDNLPKLLRGYGKSLAGFPAAVLVVCDLDDRDRGAFLGELQNVLAQCIPAPNARFCLAIEEGEAWLLGDIPAVLAAYPSARRDVLDDYVNDAICGTWEVLADSLVRGGHIALSRNGWWAVGAAKSEWAKSIPPHMEPNRNQSPSFREFLTAIDDLVNEPD